MSEPRERQHVERGLPIEENIATLRAILRTLNQRITERETHLMTLDIQITAIRQGEQHAHQQD